MKKLFIFSIVILAAFACKKPEELKNPVTTTPKTLTYEDTLAGSWDLVAVSYQAEIPDLTGSGAPTQISGDATAVSGEFFLTQDPNELDYSMKFNAELDFSGINIPIPVDESGAALWTVSPSGKVVYLEATQSTNIELTALNVIEKSLNKQIFSTTFPYSVGGLVTIDIEALITIERIKP